MYFIFLQLLVNIKDTFASAISFSTISQYKRYFCKYLFLNYLYNVAPPFASAIEDRDYVLFSLEKKKNITLIIDEKVLHTENMRENYLCP